MPNTVVSTSYSRSSNLAVVKRNGVIDSVTVWVTGDPATSTVRHLSGVVAPTVGEPLPRRRA